MRTDSELDPVGDRAVLADKPGVREVVAGGVVAVLGVAGVVFTEAAILVLVAALGPMAAFGVLTLACVSVSLLIAYALDSERSAPGAAGIVGRARAWVSRKRAYAEERALRLAHLSEALAFAVLSVTVGPFVTAIVVMLRVQDVRTGYLLCALSSVLFSAFWVFVYSGGLALLGKVFGH